MIVLSWWLVNHPQIDRYLGNLHSETVTAVVEKTDLFQKIKMKAEEINVPAQDAKIDRVWQAIPGYNGLKVDEKASYKKMKAANKFDEKKLVIKQVKPEVHLKDLPPTAIYKGHPEKPMVSFLINVAWGNEYLSSMLATLKKHHVKATFFLEGRWVRENPELAKMIAEAGHEIGNHSYSHPDFKKLSAAQTKAEIKKTNDVIKATTDKTCVWFAPPSGSYREETVKIADQFNLGTVMWSVDTIDWQKPSVSVLMDRVMTKVHPGAMILMHPTEPTAQALDELITQIKARDLQIDTVSSLLSETRLDEKGRKKNETDASEKE